MEMTSDTIHDIRNVVASIKAYVQILKRRIEKNNLAESSEYLMKIDEKADILTSMLHSNATPPSQPNK